MMVSKIRTELDKFDEKLDRFNRKQAGKSTTDDEVQSQAER
jgi:hypothetical protein